MAYIGSRPDNVISRNAQNEYNYTATGGQTTFTGADSNNNTLSYTPGNIEVYFNGARLEESDFTATNGTSIVLANAAVVNDELSIVAMRVFEVGSISNFNTSDLAEGSNLYFTNARADARIAAADTDDLSEGSTNLYFTNARADARIAAADTDDLSEGSTNLYFTNARVAGYLSSNDFDTATNIVASITDSAPSTLDTLNELAAALGDDANFSTTVTNSIATKLPLAGGTMTGDIDMSTHQIVFDNNSQAIQIKDAGGTASYVLYQDNSDTLILGNGTTVEKIRLDTSGNEGAVVIDTNGNVGIGTNNPGNPLHVTGGDVGGVVKVEQTVSTNTPTMFIKQTGEGGNNNVNQGLLIEVDGSNSGDGNIIKAIGTNSNLNGGANVHAFVVKNSGNVGIGIESPATTLTIDGDTSIRAASTGDSYKLYFGNEVTTGPGKAIFMEDYYMKIQGHRNEGIRLQGVNATGVVQEFATFYGDANAKASQIILAPTGGDVGIGTTNPISELSIDGQLTFMPPSGSSSSANSGMHLRSYLSGASAAQVGGVIGGAANNDDNNSIWLRVGYDNTIDTVDTHAYDRIRFYTGNTIANQVKRAEISSAGLELNGPIVGSLQLVTSQNPINSTYDADKFFTYTPEQNLSYSTWDFGQSTSIRYHARPSYGNVGYIRLGPNPDTYILPQGWSGTVYFDAYAGTGNYATSVVLQTLDKGSSTWNDRASSADAGSGTFSGTLNWTISTPLTVPVALRWKLTQGSGVGSSSIYCQLSNIKITGLTQEHKDAVFSSPLTSHNGAVTPGSKGRYTGGQLYQPGIVTDDLIIYFDFNNKACHSGTSGNTEAPLDLSPLQHETSFHGTATISNNNGQVVYKNQGQGGRININNVDLGATSTGKTWEAWVKTNEESGWNTVWDTGNERPLFGFSGNTLRVYPDGNAAGDWRLTRDHWNHIVLAFGTNNTYNVYVNGYKYGSNINYGSNTQRSGISQIWLGGDSGAESLDGYISIGRLYKRQLSDEEVAQNYNAELNRHLQTPLLDVARIQRWHMPSTSYGVTTNSTTYTNVGGAINYNFVKPGNTLLIDYFSQTWMGSTSNGSGDVYLRLLVNGGDVWRNERALGNFDADSTRQHLYLHSKVLTTVPYTTSSTISLQWQIRVSGSIPGGINWHHTGDVSNQMILHEYSGRGTF